jgi:DNA-binding MarR family transcriptional regulator
MTREELFEFIQKIDDPLKDYGKILANLHYTHYYLMDGYKKILDSYDLTFIQSNVLGIIIHQYPKSLSLEEIKAMVLEAGSDVSRIVARLSGKGFIEKITDDENRRKLSIRATAKGLEISRQMEADQRFKEFTQGVSLSESKAFIKFLGKLRQH